MKRIFIILVLLLLIAPVAILAMLGISPLSIPDAMRVGSGITAKLACSGYYLSGFNDEQNLRDIATYSPASEAVAMRHVQPDSIEADTGGMMTATARYYPGLGCTLEYPGMKDFTELEVPRLPQRSGPWPEGEDVGTPLPEVQRALDRLLAQDAAQGLDTRALLVVKDGRVVAESYKEGIDTDTPLLGWSMGKSVSAIMLGRMEAMGLVDVDNSHLFPAWEGDARRDIRLKHLLQMSSGLDFDEPYVPGSDSTRMLFFSPSAANVAMESELAQTPGSHFYYSSGTSNLLTRLVWDQLGGDTQALLDFFATELAIPLGLGNTTLELDASGVFVGSSYIYAPARDWARLGLLMLDDGRAGERRLLPAGWVGRAVQPNSSDNDPRYGYQFWLNAGGPEPRWPDLEQGAYAMLGNRGQVVMLLPTLNTVIVRLGWTAGSYPKSEKFAPLQRAIEAR